MKEQSISNLLQNIGLDELEIHCYIQLLKKSPQKASEIARRLEIPKTTVLLALQKLSNEFHIVKRMKRKNTYLFSVDDPTEILRFVQQRQQQLKDQEQKIQSALPELRAMQQYETVKPKMYYYEGKEGMKKAFLQVLEEADHIIGYGSNEDELKYLPSLYPDYYKKRVAKKISVKAIIPATLFNIQHTLETEQKHIRHSRLIPAECNYPIEVNVYKHTVIFFSYEENFALVIKSKPIADCLQKMFEFAFEYSEKFDQDIRKRLQK
ncbi:MAG: hypothetical protein HYV32_02735 [Candidatus Kerfeldbacteria bacterium]|nr:hypothetical protein [Candidatus Kerfeldbacteria bacterium]